MQETSRKNIIKCVVWDLDNTIWHGILSEHDDLKLRNGMEKILKELDRRGIIHSIASKNSYEDAIKTLDLFKIKDYFLYPQISWENKSAALTTIQKNLNIGYDAIAFIDDQSFERDEVKFEHPDISCYDVDIIEDILSMEQFKPKFITEESTQRRKMYLQDDLRNDEEKKINNNNKFLDQLNMEFIISIATIKDLQRVEELTVRTNQLNATGYTYSYEELEGFILSPRYKLFTAELIDKYGTYGKIGVMLVECTGNVWTLKLLLMSCRVMSRGVGTVMLYYIINLAKENGKKMHAEFLSTDRNRVMYVTYKFAGFKEISSLENGGSLLEHSLTDFYQYPEYIKVKTDAGGQFVS
ncbi:MAG: HAD-IIIC family phosphatase [Chitinophagaceae bacterium]